MRGQLSYLQGNLSILRDINWIDRQTRAVFVEFSVYNPNINLIMVSTILIEFLSSGSILTTARFDPLNLFNELGVDSTLKLIFEAIFILFIIYFTAIEIWSLAKTSFKEYATDFWSFLEWSIMLSAWTSIVLFLNRYVLAKDVLSFFQNTGGYGYMKLQRVNDCNQMLTYSLGLCASLATIKSLKILRFNSSIALVGLTLKRCFLELASFSLIFFIVWIAFVQIMYLEFCTTLEDFATITRSMQSAFLYMLGKFDILAISSSSPIFGPVLFSTYSSVVLFFALNIFVTIIVEAFEMVREESKIKPKKLELLKHKIFERFKAKKRANTLPNHEKYRDHLSIISCRVDNLIGFVINVTTFKLLNLTIFSKKKE